MRDIFISYVEEDSELAIELADELEAEGFSTWYYQRDSIPGVPYLSVAGDAVEDCNVFLILISANSIDSHQVSRELERAHDCGKIFVPVLVDLTHSEFITLQPSWRHAVGAYTSIQIPPEGVSACIPSIIKGLEMMNIYPKGKIPPGQKIIRRKPGRQKTDTARILDLIGARVAAEGQRSFIFGFKPSTRNVYGRNHLVDECVNLIESDSDEFICYYGTGGIGKSTLASLIFSHFAEDKNSAFDSCIWYDLRAEPHPETALLHLVTIITRGNVPAPSSDKSPFDMWLNLLGYKLTEYPMLVVFDNLDFTFDPDAEAGEFADERWGQLFRTFMDVKSAVILTSRQLPRFHGPSMELRHVEGIAAEEATDLMVNAGLKDDNSVLLEAHRLLQGHPMAITALTAAVMRRPSYGARLSKAGDIMNAIRRCPDKSLNPVVLFEEVINPDHLPESEFSLITALPVLLRPETADTIYALRPEADPDDISYALDELYLRSLVQVDVEVDPPRYSLHPIIKEVAEHHMKDAELLNQRVYDHYLAMPWNPETTNPTDVEHLRFAVFHALTNNDLVRSGRVLYDETQLSGMLSKWGRYDLALPLHRQEYEIASETGNDSEQMIAAGLLSKCLTRVGHTRDALIYAETALDIAVRLGNRQYECAYRSQIGRIYFLTGDFDQSRNWLEETLDIAVETGDRRKEGIIQGYLGQISKIRGKFDNAIQSLEKAIEIAGEFGDRSSEIECRGLIGQIHSLRGEYDKALTILNPALDHAIDIGDKINESKIGTLIGQIQMWRGDLELARRQFEQALDVDREIGYRRHEGALLTLIGKIYNRRGEHEKALEIFQESLDIAIELGSRAAEAYRRGQLGEVYLAMGEYDKALEYFQEAYEFAVKAENKTNECVYGGFIGELYLNCGELDKALEFLQSALELSIEMKDRENEGEWRGKIGWLYREKGNYNDAVEWLEKALAMAREIGDPVNEKYHRTNLGKCFIAVGKPCDAVPHFERVLEIAKMLGMTEQLVTEAEKNFEDAKEECSKSEV